MPVNPRTPVLVGYGQINHREDATGQANFPEPVDLMAAAAREAADPRVLEAVDAIRVVNLLSARYRDAGLLLGQRIGADHPATRYSGIGGNVPQSLVNRACMDIQQGHADVVLVAGAEMWRTRTQLRAAGQRLAYTEQDESVPLARRQRRERADGRGRRGPHRPGPPVRTSTRCSSRHCGSARGSRVDEHRKRIGELWARFNEVAVRNPHAWIRKSVAAEDIWQQGPTNRMISWPYTKLMNSNNMVDQSAALLLTSVETATRLKNTYRTMGVTRMPAPMRTTPTRSASAPNCTARRPSGSPVRER